MRKHKGEKKWDRRTYPVTDPGSLGSWKAAEIEKRVRKKTKIKENKPFEIKHYRFFPCVLSKHVQAGYVYYLIVMDFKRRVKLEADCPVFKSKAEAIAFVDSNSLTGLLPG